MKRQLASIAAAVLLCAGIPTPASAGAHVFLVQNSGWMDPFYADPSSQFKPLVTEIVMAAVQAGDAMVLASFNQGLPGAPSPKALLAQKVEPAATRRQVKAALDALAVARKPGSSALADTDLNEALGAAIGTALGGKPGLVWLFTNNRNSPNNDQATAQRNREFYELIHRGDTIAKVLAFPLKMPVQGAQYRANGLMVYVFAVGEQGARELDALMASGRIQRIVTEPAARLKPLDRDTVRLVPHKVADAPGVAFTSVAGGLRADVEADAVTPQARIEWRLENAIYPYTIASADIAARTVLAGEERPVKLEGNRITGLAPGKSAPLASAVALPVGRIPGKWSAAAIGAAGSAHVMPGRIELQLSGQKLELSQAFRQRMAELFPGDPLPEIFTPPAQIKGSTALLPLDVRVHYGIAPLAAAIGAALALLAALAAAALAYGRPRKALVTVEDELRTMQGRPGTTQPIYDKTGNKVAQLKTTLFGHQLIDLREGAQVRLGR